MSSRPPRRTRQSCLEFTPVSSSSPAAAQLSPDVRHRAGIVDYDESPRKKQRTSEGQKPAGINNFGPLTPISSLPKDFSGAFGSTTRANPGSPALSDQGEVIENSDSSEDEPLPTSQRRSNTFFNSSTQKSQRKLNLAGSKDKASPAQAAGESSSEDELPTSAARRRQASASKDNTRMTRAKAQGNSNGSLKSHRHEPRLSRLSRGTKQAPMVILDDDLGEAESSGDEMMASSPGVRARGSGRRPVEAYSEEEESDEIEPTPRRRRRNARSTPSSASDDDDLPASRTRRIKRQNADPDSEDENKNGHRRKQQEQEDLQEDLEFLGTPAKKARSRKSPRQKTARELALEKLKRSRAGQNIDAVEEDQPEPSRRRALYDTESESESETVQELDEEEEEEDVDEDVDQDETRPAIYQASSMAMFQEDDDDQDFLVEDEDEPLGAPDEEAQIPLQFTSTSRMKGKDLFKYAVEWMVQKKLNPGFSMNDEIYTLTFHKLDDEANTMSGSKFTSSAWTKDFTRALHARPFIEVTEITGINRSLLAAHCGACNRTNHPATFDIRFTGKPYHRESLEELDDDGDDEDEDDDDGEDNESFNSQGLSIPSADHIFHTGVHCKTNAQTAHALAHWRYHLNEWVVDWLRAEDHLTAEKIVERDNMSTGQRRRYANEVVDDMAERGEIQLLYKHFRAEIDTARNAKQASWGRYKR
ncbi:uncharacterized protein IWZ02DRAFT_294632 [Phyllosticta citriasiana]|uniref:uncharacterized protein n=1 Tax=Phyllosticta citriasiana TaxID=595635 RepID=UPI0030FDCA74